MNQHASRRGSIFVVMLLLLPIIILFAGFAVDVAYVQRVKTELRSATDLAAKAAALDLSQYSNATSARKPLKSIAATLTSGTSTARILTVSRSTLTAWTKGAQTNQTRPAAKNKRFMMWSLPGAESRERSVEGSYDFR